MFRLSFILLFVFSFLFWGPAFAKEDWRPDDTYFKKIRMQDEGRIKPLDTFAENLLYTLSGKHKFGDMNANAWLAEALFNPDEAALRDVIYIRDKKLLALVKLPPRDGHRYSLAEMLPTLKETLPLVVQLVNIPEAERTAEQNALLGLHERALKLSKLLRSLTFVIETDIFRVMPRENNVWSSPFQAAEKRENAGAMKHWLALMKAYNAQDAAKFKKHSKALASNDWKTRLEIFYHSMQPFKLACLFYAFGLLFQLVRTRYKLPNFMPGFAAGIICHSAGIIMRVLILDRPPVGTLYESILFVAFICVIAGAFFKKRITGTGIGLALLLVSFGFIQNGDTLSVLTAVLNTNFWLATHVLCITAGYGASLVAGCMGHAALLNNKSENIYKVTGLAMLLTAVGTLLGGIWADQSWGRFWGWDPKENGALFLTLWLAWLLHGRHGKIISDKLFYAGMAATNIIVALSWFGVNLLGVGLHSYGFTTGVGAALAVFCLGELVLIALLYRRKIKYA